MRGKVFKSAAGFRQLPQCLAAALIFLAIAASSGCQSLALGSMAGFSAARQEKKILKQAENDPFPSPADVGLEEAREPDDGPER
jgi:hypothetical protein